MDEQCSIGQTVDEECHKTVYGFISKDLKQLNDLDDNVQKLLKLRVNDSISSVCEYHEKNIY